MKYIGFNICTSTFVKDVNQFIENISNNEYDKIIFFFQTEYQYWGIDRFNEILDILRSKNKRLQVLTGASKYLKKQPYEDEVDLYLWPEHWIVRTYLFLDQKSVIEDIDSLDYKYPFISMNYRPHYHRCLLMDLLAKYNIIESNAISWHMPKECYYVDYSWKYWNEQQLLLDDIYSNISGNYLFPTEYYTSFAQLISETDSNDAILISEKTASALLLGKPFLAATTPGFHKSLKELGFELYTEVFDYSFDDIEDITDRYDVLLQNFVRLSKMSTTQLKSLNSLVKDKVNHNKEWAKKIVFDFDKFPDIAKDVIKIYNNTKTVVDLMQVEVYQTLLSLKS